MWIQIFTPTCERFGIPSPLTAFEVNNRSKPRPNWFRQSNRNVAHIIGLAFKLGHKQYCQHSDGFVNVVFTEIMFERKNFLKWATSLSLNFAFGLRFSTVKWCVYRTNSVIDDSRRHPSRQMNTATIFLPLQNPPLPSFNNCIYSCKVARFLDWQVF